MPARTFATFRSRCLLCDEPIEVDDEIVLYDEGEWVHVDCYDNDDDEDA